jgi:prolyl oligopeptidase
MGNFFLFLILLLPQFVVAQIIYPESPKKPIVDNYHNIEVIDNYQWLEFQETDEAKDWIKAQNQLSKKSLKKISRNLKTESQMNGFMYARTGDYFGEIINEQPENQYYFTLCSTSNTAPPSLCYKKGRDTSYDILVKSSALGSRDDVNIYYYKPSKNDDYLAFQYNRNGSDWSEIRVVKVKKKRFYTEVIKHTRSSSIYWLRDGFFYEKYPFDSLRAKTKKPSIMYHKIDTNASDDKLIFKSRKDSEYVDIYGAPDESFFIIKKENIDTKVFSYFYLNANDNILTFKPFLINIKYDLSGFIFKEKQIYATTSINKKDQLIFIPKADPTKFKVISPIYKDAVLQDYSIMNDKAIVLYSSKNGDLMTLVNFEGLILKETSTPSGLSVKGMRYNNTFDEFFFHLESYTVPKVLYKLDLETFEYELVNQTKVNFDPKGYKFIERTFKSKDGVEVPIKIVYKDSLKDSNIPFLLSTYGGYGTIDSRNYNPGIIYFIENGGAFAYVNIRGGGEFGKDWWELGKRLNKQNGILDFISAAEFLVDQKYTSPNKIAIIGSSHGGLIVAASAVQRPDLFGAAVVNVAPLDMLRFENFTVGATVTNVLEFGTVINRLDFENLYSYSPYHNIDDTVNYPSMLITTGFYDNRVPPLHSFKLAARLQNNPSQQNPIFLWTQKKTGHNGALNKNDKLKENSFIYGFLFNAVNK